MYLFYAATPPWQSPHWSCWWAGWRIQVSHRERHSFVSQVFFTGLFAGAWRRGPGVYSRLLNGGYLLVKKRVKISRISRWMFFFCRLNINPQVNIVQERFERILVFYDPVREDMLKAQHSPFLTWNLQHCKVQISVYGFWHSQWSLPSTGKFHAVLTQIFLLFFFNSESENNSMKQFWTQADWMKGSQTYFEVA